MEGTAVAKRELYLDITCEETELLEIYLYQVDFLQQDTFRTKEYVFRMPEEGTPSDEAEPVELKEQFYEVWKQLLSEKIKTECFATDAVLLMSRLFMPLHRRHPEEKLFFTADAEPLHDCISMGRVVSMSMFDEKQYLGAGSRRRMKEKYHVLSEEVKHRKPFHLFLSEEREGTAAYLLTVTDDMLRTLEETHLSVAANEEPAAMKLAGILKRYPEADIVVDAASERLYRLFQNMNLFLHSRQIPVVYSLTSMLLALGKDRKRIFDSAEGKQIGIFVYRTYIRTAEAVRFGQFREGRMEERLYFYLPVRISSEKAWKKQFKNNRIWKALDVDGTGYEIDTTEEIKAKYTMKAGDEQFVLRVTNISIRRYLREYAVFEMETENCRYAGKIDKERIRTLGSCLYPEPHNGAMGAVNLPDLLELKIKTKESSYSLSAFHASQPGTGQAVWFSGLFTLGRKRKAGKKAEQVLLESCSDCMFVSGQKDEAVRVALVKDEYLRLIETELAAAAAPKKKSHREGRLNRGRKRQIRRLYEAFRYLAVSFGEGQERPAENSRTAVEEQRGTKIRVERLTQKFQLY